MNKKQTLLALLVTIIWGVNFPVIKIALSEFSSLSFTALRFSISALVLLPFCPLPREHWRGVLYLSLVMGTGHFGLFFYGMSLDIEAAAASVLLQLGPPLTVLFGAILYKEKVKSLQIIGIMMSVLGVVTLIGLPKAPPPLYPATILIGCSALWAAGNIMMKELREIPTLSILCWLSAFSAIQMIIIRLYFEGVTIPDAPLTHYALLLYPAIASTVVAYGIWTTLLKSVPITLLAPYGLLTPFFGVLSSVLILGDSFELAHCVGALFICAGVAFSTIFPNLNAERMRRRLQENLTKPEVTKTV